MKTAIDIVDLPMKDGEHFHSYVNVYQRVHIIPVCTAQGGGGSFKDTKPRRLVAVNHGSQSESTDGSKSGWRQRSVGVVEM